MAKRLSVKRQKQVKDRQTEHKKSPSLHPHKIDQARSKKMKAKKINRAR
jgi:hypothetical protein